MAPVKPRVLAVDEDHLLLQLLGDLLSARGYEATGHARWDSAYATIKAWTPDVVLLGPCYGRMTADAPDWDLLSLLLLDPATAAIPLIVMPYPGGEDRLHWESLQGRGGTIHVLTKPFDLAALLTLLNSLVPAQRPERLEVSRRLPADGPLPGQVTARELEIACLVAAGLTNAEIARRLIVARGTVANHVEHILNKLGFAHRAQIATWYTRLEKPASPTTAPLVPFRSWNRRPRVAVAPETRRRADPR